MSNIAVVGCGHVGLVVAAGLAELGHNVTGIDVNDTLVTRLNAGTVDIVEDGLTKLVRDGIDEGRLRFTVNYSDAIPEAEFVFLCVDTPQTNGGAANLTSIRNAVRSIVSNVGTGNPIIVNKSTSPIGTAETIESLIVAQATPDLTGLDTTGATIIPPKPRVVACPEFLRQGHAVYDFRNPDRIVVGARDHADAEAVALLFAPVSPTIRTDFRTAELIKYTANAFLATRVSFINEIASLCEALGADVDTVVNGVAPDPRIGRAMFIPGIGYGGSCLPKDVAALRHVGSMNGIATPMLSAVQHVNEAARTRIVRRLRQMLPMDLADARIGVWGLTFKGDTEDTRDSPALEVVAMLHNEGAKLRAYDPAVAHHHERAPYWMRPLLVQTEYHAATDADALVVLTDWSDFQHVDLHTVRSHMRGSLLVDGRNVIDPECAYDAGLIYAGVGR